jgi:hypothetical protein
VKHGRKTASQDTRIVGAVGWLVAGSMRFCVIESVESSRIRRARVSRLRADITAIARDKGSGFSAYVDIFPVK